MKMLCIQENSWARYCKICDVLDSKLEQTQVSLQSFSMKMFGIFKKRQKDYKSTLLAFMMSVLQCI